MSISQEPRPEFLQELFVAHLRKTLEEEVLKAISPSMNAAIENAIRGMQMHVENQYHALAQRYVIHITHKEIK